MKYEIRNIQNVLIPFFLMNVCFVVDNADVTDHDAVTSGRDLVPGGGRPAGSDLGGRG